MHLLLTDQLTCPRCGPEFGLILLADRLEDRRVHDGSLGCPNCRDRFPVEAGFGDLRPPPRTDLSGAEALEPPDSPQLVELAGLLGIVEGPGQVALLGGMAGHAEALAAAIPGLEVVGIAEGLRARAEVEGVSRLAAGGPLPFRSSSLRGVGLFGAETRHAVEEVARVVSRAGRVVVWGDVARWEPGLEKVGLDVLVSEEAALVAVRR